MKLAYSLLLLIFLAACTTGNVTLDTAQQENASTLSNPTLFVDPQTAQLQLSQFQQKLRISGKDTNKRSLYEEYIDQIGANGIIDSLNTVYEGCHSQAHDLGKIIYAKTKDISSALRICGDSCYTGCMHGVLMEAFSTARDVNDEEGHIDLDKLKPQLKQICLDNKEMQTGYGPGECSHGVGHALMFLSGYNITRAIEACKQFDNANLAYFCADGVYMEYMTVKETETHTQSTFFPCDSHPFVVPCMRNKVGLVAKRIYQNGKSAMDVAKLCDEQTGKLRLGCFHGLGTSHSTIVVKNKIGLAKLCSLGNNDDQITCIEGAVEFIGKYYPESVEKICATLPELRQETCLLGGKHKLYSTEKDLSLYLE